ncbi:MAG: glucosaminidase domain-containing protein [Lewinellaceae bacterium]|nr:glucosaminidase domain-containing protein [Lewinellaceae bacterium]
MMQYGLTQAQQSGLGFSLQGISDSLSRNWFRGLLLGMGIYALFFKDISIQFNLGAPQLVSNSSLIITPEGVREVEESSASAFPARYSEEAPRNVSQLKSGSSKATKGKKWDTRKANDFSNLTFILSPTYARRHNIHPDIVEAKVGACKAYVRQYASAALQEMRQYGIPASITLAQGLLESNAGESRLSLESNNHFGIKCRTKCRGCTCRNYTDDGLYDMFRVFEAPAESYREHSMLLNSPRYKHLHKLRQTDYKGWAHGLKKAGYATDKRYAEKLIQIIEFLGLQKYDRAA